MEEPRYNVISGGFYVRVAAPREEAWRAALEWTTGKIEVVQGVQVPVIACVYEYGAAKPGVLPRPVAMFEDGKEVPFT